MSNQSEDRKPSRRQFLGVAAATSAALATAGGEVTRAAQAPVTAPAAAGAPRPDLYLTNGRIHTLDAGNRVVSAVWIQNGRIAGVGDRAPRATPGARVINLRGRTVVPGLIEAHVHIVSLA